MSKPTIHPSHKGNYLQCASWAIRGPEGALLIDTGSGVYEEEVISNLAAQGIAEREIKAILLTHCHSDHTMGADRLAGRLGVPIYASKRTAEVLRTCDSEVWGEHPELIPRVDVDFEFADGDRLSLAGIDVRCVATPGHTNGCFSFVVEADTGRVGFTGDVMMWNCSPGWAGGKEFSAMKTMASLERLCTLDLGRAFMGHDAPMESPGVWLRSGIAYGRAGAWILGAAMGCWAVPKGLPAPGVAARRMPAPRG
jgi:glyoxylase-like metal-dependent hydrolase (beta-lactamase superfamily II)